MFANSINPMSGSSPRHNILKKKAEISPLNSTPWFKAFDYISRVQTLDKPREGTGFTISRGVQVRELVHRPEVCLPFVIGFKGIDFHRVEHVFKDAILPLATKILAKPTQNHLLPSYSIPDPFQPNTSRSVPVNPGFFPILRVNRSELKIRLTYVIVSESSRYVIFFFFFTNAMSICKGSFIEFLLR